MTTYKTGNPLGSTDPRDLYDNAENLDDAVNSDAPSWTDRFGKNRKSMAGMEDEFDGAIERFNRFITQSGYQFLGDYAAGIKVTEYNQIVRDSSGEFWRLSGQVDLPYTTDGSGLPENDAFVPVGDAALRQELGTSAWLDVGDGPLQVPTNEALADPGKGARRIARSVVVMGSLSELLLIPREERGSSKQFVVESEGVQFYWDASDLSVEVSGDLGGVAYIAPPEDESGSSGAWVLAGSGIFTPTTVTVGPEGDFPSINRAISALSRRFPIYRAGGLIVSVLLKSGFVMRESVFVEGVDLSWIRIESEDAEVPIERASLTTSVSGRFPAFGGRDGAVLPVIAALFSMDSSGEAALRDGVFVTNRSAVQVLAGCGVKNAGERGLHVSNASNANARGSVFSGAATIGIRVANGSSANIRDAKATDCGVAGLGTASNSDVCADYCDFSRAGASGLFAQTSRISFQMGIADDCHLTPGVGYTGSIEAQYGSIIYAGGASVKRAGKNAITVLESVFVGYASVTDRRVDASGAAENAVSCLNSSVVLRRADLSGAGGSALVSEFSSVVVDSADMRNSGGFAIDAIGGAVGAPGVLAQGSLLGIRARRGAVVESRTANVSGSRTGFYASEGGRISAAYASASGCGTAVEVLDGGEVSCPYIDASGATDFGFRVRGGGRASAYSANARKGPEDSPQDFFVATGGIIQAANAIGGSNVEPNSISTDGILIR